MALHKVHYRGDKIEDVEKSTTENMSDHITDTEQSDLDDNSSDSIIVYCNSDLFYYESDDKHAFELV